MFYLNCMPKNKIVNKSKKVKLIKKLYESNLPKNKIELIINSLHLI